MAVPTIISTISGQLNTPNVHEHVIPMPPGLEAGDVIICFIFCNRYATAILRHEECSINFTNTGLNELYRNFTYRRVNYYFNITHAFVKAIALGGGQDFLKVKTYLLMYNFGHADVVSEYTRDSKLSYICYRITNARVFGGYVPSNKVWHFNAQYPDSYNWEVPQFPHHALDLPDDSLWILGVGSEHGQVATASPPGWSSLIKTTGSILSPGSSSASSCYIGTTNGENQIGPSYFNAPVSVYAGTLVRLFDLNQAEEPEIDPPEPISDGFYIPLYRKEVFVYSEITVSVEVTRNILHFSDNRSACGSGDFIIVTANNDWTASWENDTYFDASTYNGVPGQIYIYISCRSVNLTGSIRFDLLKITCGDLNVDIYVYQNSSGNGCTFEGVEQPI